MDDNHVMIDFETLGTGSDTVVLSLGAVKFHEDEVSDDHFHYLFDVQDQLNEGRSVTAATIQWWLRQSWEARKQFTEAGRMEHPVESVLFAFTEWFKGSKYIWSHGSNFDTVILDDLYRGWGHKAPWQFSNVRDTRTLFDVYNSTVSPPEVLKLKSLLKPGGITAHNALTDSINQANAVGHALKVLKG